MPARPRRYFVDTADGFIHVQDCGESDAERVVAFVSITSFGGVLLDRVLPLLAGRGYRVLAFDLMGYGLSDKRRDTWLIPRFADNLAQAVALTGSVPGGYVFGHFAGLVGVEYAARRTRGLRGLVLDGTPLVDVERQRNFDPAALPAPIAWTEDGAHASCTASTQKYPWRLNRQTSYARPISPTWRWPASNRVRRRRITGSMPGHACGILMCRRWSCAPIRTGICLITRLGSTAYLTAVHAGFMACTPCMNSNGPTVPKSTLRRSTIFSRPCFRPGAKGPVATWQPARSLWSWSCIP